MPILRRLLQDPEAEVRTHAIFQLPTVGENLPSADRQTMLLTNLMAPITDLVGDAYVVAPRCPLFSFFFNSLVLSALTCRFLFSLVAPQCSGTTTCAWLSRPSLRS